MPCETMLNLLTTEYVLTLIVDTGFADKVNKKANCSMADYPPKMALPSIMFPEGNKDILTYKNDPKNNYYVIHDDDYRRAIFKYDHSTRHIWRENHNALLPQNVTIFKEIGSRSQFIDCLNNTGLSTVRTKWNETTVFLCCGTLLGWHRECGFISHDHDVDFCYRSEEYNPEAFGIMHETKQPFPIRHSFGKHRLNKEFAFATNPSMDLFEVVSLNDGTSYIPIVVGKKAYQSVYPARLSGWCAGDLYGLLFWVMCDPSVALRAEYGDGWTIRNPNMTYTHTKNLVKIRGIQQ